MRQDEFKKSFDSYDAMSSMLKTRSYEEILSAAAEMADCPPENLERYPMGLHCKDMTSLGIYRFTLRDLMKNIRHYDWLYSRLEDNASRVVFSNLIGFRIIPAQDFLKAAYDGGHPQYFDKDIVSCDENEVFADCGGYTGDTAEEFIRQFGNYKQIYVYEPERKNLPICRENLSKYDHVTLRPCGVGEKSDSLELDGGGSAGTFGKGKKSADSEKVQVVSLDEDIREPITFLKMDIEGFEIPALLGAKRHIRDDFPKLAICLYHIVSDMWEIPRLIDAIHPGYRFYIRHYHASQNWETVLYAIPPKAEQEAPAVGRKRVAAVNFDKGWDNAQLLKGCCAIPYLLHKNHHCESSLVGGRFEADYPNIKYLPGMEMEFLPDGSVQAKVEYMMKHAGQIDCVTFHGPYPMHFPVAERYKKLNPHGKIVITLDENSHWMDRIQWDEPEFRAFMDRCDVICAASRAMQRHLNEKWPWPIEYAPKGFYNFSPTPWDVDFSKKKNIILTVGRLGTPQKATDVLLEAFAKIAGQIPGWELHLAGGIEDSFRGWLDGYWRRNPKLKKRVRFLGRIADRDVLYDTYRRAKIFALTSVLEGGANVTAEALSSGCAMAITQIDEHLDATDNGRCGLSSPIGDVNGFANNLLRLCRSGRLDEMCRDAYAYAREVYDLEKIVARINKLTFGWEA